MVDGLPGTHRCVGLVLCDGDQVLLAKRCAAKSWYPNCWDLIGGHLEPGESKLQAVIREAAEELGIRLDPAQLVLVDTVTTDDIELAVFATSRWDGTPVNAAPEEHDLIAWFAVDDVAGLNLADPAINEVVVKALQIQPRS